MSIEDRIHSEESFEESSQSLDLTFPLENAHLDRENTTDSTAPSNALSENNEDIPQFPEFERTLSIDEEVMVNDGATHPKENRKRTRQKKYIDPAMPRRTRLPEHGPENHWSPKSKSPRINLNSMSEPQNKYIGVDRAEDEMLTDFFTRGEKYPLLTKELEQLLFTVMKEGGTIDDVKTDERFFGLFKEEDREKAENLLVDSKTIKEAIFHANMRFVTYIAQRHKGKLPFSDLIQEGNRGMLIAIDKFEPERGLKLSTYATFWVEQVIRRAIADKGFSIRLPVHFREQINQVREYVRGYNNYYNADPTVNEVKQILMKKGASETVANNILKFILKGGIARELSADKTIQTKESTDLTLGDTLVDTSRESNTEGSVEDKLFREDVHNTIKRLLPERVALVILDRHGLIDGEKKTLREVADRHNISPERVRQLEAQGFNILRRDAEHLTSYFR